MPSLPTHKKKAKLRTNSWASKFMRMRIRNVAIIFTLVVVATWMCQSNLPPSPRLCGLPGGPPITAPRVKLKDGRHLAYKELGVPRENANSKIVFLHGFACSRHDVVVAHRLSQKVFEELGVYIVSFDRPGYGESDPDPKRTIKSMALDIEQLADHLNLGERFYVIGFSMGGQQVWGSLKYIPHRLAGAALLAPVVNYWWNGFPANLSKEAFERQLPQDQWAQRVAHYVPWLTYWWNTQKHFPGSSVAARKAPARVTQQGEYESLYRDMMIGFGRWEFSPMDLKDPLPSKQGAVQLWQGDDDSLVPVTLQRCIVKKLPWIKYHELPGAGHMFPHGHRMPEAILRSLLLGET